jgi:hypothetical protein
LRPDRAARNPGNELIHASARLHEPRLRWFTRPPPRQIYPLIAWLQAAREEFEVKDAQSAPPNRAFTRVNALMGGDPYGVVLEFKFLSHKMVAEQSMET